MKEESRATIKAEAAVCLQGFGFVFTWAKVNPHRAVPDLMFFCCANRSRMRGGWRAVRANPAKANTDRGAAEQEELARLRAVLGQAPPTWGQALAKGLCQVSAQCPFLPAATAKAGPHVPAATGGASGVRGAARCPRPPP